MKKTKQVFIFLMLCLMGCMPSLAQQISIIPQPQEINMGKGNFHFGKEITLALPSYPNDSIREVAENFATLLENTTLLPTHIINQAKKANIQLVLDKKIAAEGYQLRITPKQIVVMASHPAGFYYAFQTIVQLMPRNVAAHIADANIRCWTLPCLTIKDAPRFGWRGFMIDEGRHFFGKQEIKKIIDMMAIYKMNRLHWHLTEDQGWRIEIKKYPKLTEVGAWRIGERLAWGNYKGDDKRYGGFYTQEDIKEIVKYAKSRFVEIVPEIDIPGHSQAAVAAYPELLACDPDQPHTVWSSQGISTDVINVANPQAVQFAKDVIHEVCQLFPFGYLHLGGDECPINKWKENTSCKELLTSLKSTNYRDLQIHFYQQLQDYINQLPSQERKKLIFWNEVLHGDVKLLGKDIVIMAWIGANKAALEAAKMGLNTILTPQIPYYINRKQSKSPDEPLTQGNGSETVEAVYAYQPLKDVPQELQHFYMGVQANCWTEYIITPSLLEYVLFPRLLAVAEAAWTPQSERHYSNFVERLQSNSLLFRLKGLNYGKHIMK